jgi:uncharacterized protein (TIGR02284 family)
MENIQHNSTIVNDLIGINNERINNYTTALDALKDRNHELNFFLAKMLTQSHRFISELTTQTKAFAEKESGTNARTGAIYELWINVKEKLPVGDSHTISNSCKNDLLAVLNAYDHALGHSNLHPQLQELINRHKDELKASHVEVCRTLKSDHP